MTQYEILLFVILAELEVLLCILVFSRGLQRRVPFFALYAVTMLVCCVALVFVYVRFGFGSLVAYYAGWSEVAVTLIARSSAVAEICWTTLRGYRGIWALAWRLLLVVLMIFLVHGAIDARGQLHWLTIYGLTVERDVEVASVCTFLILWAIGRYYRLPVEPLQRWLGLGICLFCAVDFINNSVARAAFAQYSHSWAVMKLQVARASDLWNTVQVSAADICVAMWCFALRKPLPEPAEPPELLPVEVYRELSPAINLRLRAFNDRLVELLRP